MKIDKNCLISDISGKVGTVIYSRYKGKRYAKAAAIDTYDPCSEKQKNMREIFAELHSNWKKLSQELKNIWESYAKTRGAKEFPVKTTSLIREKRQYMMGVNAFIGINSRLLYAGLPMVLIPPERATSGPMGFGVSDISEESFALSVSFMADTCAVGDVVRFYLKAGIKGGKSYLAESYQLSENDVVAGQEVVLKCFFESIRVNYNDQYGDIPLKLYEGKIIRAQTDHLAKTGAKSVGSRVLVIDWKKSHY